MNEASNFCNGACNDVTDDEDPPNPEDPPKDDPPTIKDLPQDDVVKNSLDRTDSKRVGFSPDDPPYAINNAGSKAALNVKTLDMTTVHYQGVLEYNCKNLFGKWRINMVILIRLINMVFIVVHVVWLFLPT